MDKITRPPQLSGTTQEQISQIWDYLAKMNDELNSRLDGIGSNELTDGERETMRPLMGAEMKSGRMISMKDMIIKTAEASQKGIREAKDKANASMAVLQPFVDGVDCPSGTNADDLTEQGIYYFSGNSAAAASNLPISTACNLITIRRRLTASWDTLTQLVIGTSNLYRRSNGSTTTSGWSEWVQLV